MYLSILSDILIFVLESLKDAGVSRHSQLVGHLGRKLDKFFVNVSDVEEKQRVVAPARDFSQDIIY